MAVSTYDRVNQDQHAKIASDIKAAFWISKLLWGLAGVFLASLGALFGWQTATITSMGEHIHQIEIEEKGNAQRGFAIADSLQKEINALQIAVAECQRRHGLRPQKE